MHKQPDLLDQLSQAAREQALDDKTRLDPRWDRLAAGQLSEEENDELLGLADASGEANEAYQAFKPLGPAFEQRVAAMIADRQAEERRVAAEAAEGLAGAAPAARPAGTRPSRSPWWGVKNLAGAISLMAAVALGAIVYRGAAVETIPGMGLEPVYGLSEMRGGPGEVPPLVPQFVAGNTIHLVAAATLPLGEKLETRLLISHGDGLLRKAEIQPKISTDRTKVRFSATVKDLGLPIGFSNLVVVVARPGREPGQDQLARAIADFGARDAESYWQVLVQRVERVQEK